MRVSKADLFKFMEAEFAAADRNKDGELEVDELQSFLNALSNPGASRKPDR